ncbi:MAG: TolC family protein [Pirellula sp.]
MRLVSFVLLALAIATHGLGCSRTRYRQAADRDSYHIVREKDSCLTNQVPSNYTIQPDPRSRFYDPSNPDCPRLPVPRPVLYGYDLPRLSSDLPMVVSSDSSTPEAPAENKKAEGTSEAEKGEEEDARSSQSAERLPQIIQATYQASVVKLVDPDSPPENRKKEPAKKDGPPGRTNGLPVNRVTIPAQAWNVLPRSCLSRMFEFELLRHEYQQTFPESEFDSQDSQSRRLTLANFMELAAINSREYQARKELLFRAALALTRQRYRFELNPSPFGNGTAANYRHLRANGITDNRLSIPSGVAVEKTLVTGGEFLARFANSVVLTFNGPTGFAADIGSEMVFDFQQTLFQRDVRFESLTQSERDVVYAVRDYLRFRKQLFRDVARQYYNLLLNYRVIEINAQDYFTNLRGFIQSQAEYRTAEKIPRIQVDQFEQSVLRTRGILVNSCFTLEAALDQLKFLLGLPTEMNIVIDLTELESISLRDELSVARQMITRARAELLNARNATTMDTTTLANVAEVLADRMDKIIRLQSRIEQLAVKDVTLRASSANNSEAFEKAARELKQLSQLLKILGLRMQVDALRAELNSQLRSDTPAPPLRVLIRAMEFSAAELQVIDLALEASLSEKAQERSDNLRRRRNAAGKKLDSFRDFLETISFNLRSTTALKSLEDLSQIPVQMEASVKLVAELDAIAAEVTKDILPTDGKSLESKVQTTVDRTIELSDRLLEKGPDGWEEIVIDHDEALLTGLVQRLDLMNQRGELADAWRQIKLAGDDLRSIVDLQASHALRTKSNANDPLDFSFDDSETRLSVALDTPLNRRLQRNNFRVALINYNVGLRNLMAAEDSIKLNIRDDLRQLASDRNQYTIQVASAALAYERVNSTQLRLQLGVQNVAARDFLEAQQAYANALSSIARFHVLYITDRTKLFFDLEAFDVDACGYWSGVREDSGPEVNVDFPSTNPRPYDWLPPRVWYSPTIRQMEQIPPGQAVVAPKN